MCGRGPNTMYKGPVVLSSPVEPILFNLRMFVLALALLPCARLPALAASPPSVNDPLIVDETSHIVVMLMIIFLGAAQDPNPSDGPLWFQIRRFLNEHPEIERKYTFRMMAGYLDSQPGLWASRAAPDGPVRIDPAYGFWSWVDRLNTSCNVFSCPYYPSYNQLENSSRAENFTASIATAGSEPGWGCPNPNAPPYCLDDSLRYGPNFSYVTLEEFMTYARQLDPIFLFIHQFNEFGPPDEDFDANTDDDIEPADLWGLGALDAVKSKIEFYRQQAAGR
jgi:hypothetical protein